jgi:hypothetical protein
MVVAEFVYICCAFVSTVCTLLLAKSYFQTRARMLLWVAIAFGFLALNNLFVCVDLVLLPDVQLWGSIVRGALLATAGTVLLGGLLWEVS